MQASPQSPYESNYKHLPPAGALSSCRLTVSMCISKFKLRQNGGRGSGREAAAAGGSHGFPCKDLHFHLTGAITGIRLLQQTLISLQADTLRVHGQIDRMEAEEAAERRRQQVEAIESPVKIFTFTPQAQSLASATSSKPSSLAG